MTSKVNVNDLHFQYQPRVSQYACLKQIWGFQLWPVMRYRADKLKFTDGPTEATTFDLKGQEIISKLFILDMSLKISNLRSKPHLPGDNE